MGAGRNAIFSGRLDLVICPGLSRWHFPRFFAFPNSHQRPQRKDVGWPGQARPSRAQWGNLRFADEFQLAGGLTACARRKCGFRWPRRRPASPPADCFGHCRGDDPGTFRQHRGGVGADSASLGNGKGDSRWRSERPLPPRAVVRPAISIIRSTRANIAACSKVGSGATVSVIRLFFGTRLVSEWRSETTRSPSPATEGSTRPRPRAGGAAPGAVALAAESADPGGPGPQSKDAEIRDPAYHVAQGDTITIDVPEAVRRRALRQRLS